MQRFYQSLIPFVHWWEIGQQRDWVREFGRSAPLDLEIGFGNGEFLARRALEHPERNLVGIDVRWSCTMRALRNLAKEEVSNARVVQMDVRAALVWLFSARSVDLATCLFPCPWRKERTIKHRLWDQRSLLHLNNRLVDGGKFRLVTDDQPYFEWVQEQLPETGFSAETAVGPSAIGTKYERKWQGLGQQQFFELSLTKTQHLSPPSKEVVEVKTRRVKHFDFRQFKPLAKSGETTLRPKEFLYDPKREIGMVRYIVVEDHLQQNLWIRISRCDGGWKIHPGSGSGFLPTAGVQEAVDLVQQSIEPGSDSNSATGSTSESGRS